jgi:dihydrofolate reductase
MKCSVFIATSLDGYIARRDGSIDWLESFEPVEGEDYGYRAFMDSVDTIVVGRNTFDTVAAFPFWPYEDKRVVVLTSRPVVLPAHAPPAGISAVADVQALYTSLEAEGADRVYVDGGKTIQQFLSAGLIDDLTITVLPILLGGGIPLFGAMGAEQRLQLAESRAYPNGFVQGRYACAPRIREQRQG